ncbi:MAG: hypothetical protein HYX53_09710 [Chloroflexi bacterium]|nr:hypothetical protein [Chloroflexota bacterium]
MLHIIGGATGQGWLFAIAVALIYVTATGFPAIAAWTSQAESATGRWLTLFAALPIGLLLTGGALWAANGRSLAWWTAPAAAILTGADTVATLWLRSRLHQRGGVARTAARRAGSRR